MKSEDEITVRIEKLRRLCIVHRYIYYVLGKNVISDTQYDKWENELRELVKLYPEIASQALYQWCCPTRTVGSEYPDSYPQGFDKLAESVVKYAELGSAGFENVPTATEGKRRVRRVSRT